MTEAMPGRESQPREDPVFIGKREFRTPLAAQWWRFFHYLRIRCYASRSVATGKWWSDTDFYLPDVGVSILAAASPDEVPARVSSQGPLLALGLIPDPAEQGEWCWPEPSPVGGTAAQTWFSFRHIAQTRQLFADHAVLAPVSPVATPRLDPSFEPDLEVRRAYWVARNGAANLTGSKKDFGEPSTTNGRPKLATVVTQLAVVSGELVMPDPADFPQSGARVLVYRHFDDAGVLLYVGISDQPSRRGKTHAAYSGWVEFAEDMTGKWCNSRAHAEALEEYLIRTLHPIFNARHNHGPQARERRRVYLAAKGRLDLLDRTA